MKSLKEFAIVIGYTCAAAGVMSFTIPVFVVTTAHVMKELEKRFPLEDKK